MASKLTPELLEKAKQAKSPEELLTLAKENGEELTEDSAKAYFDQLHKTGELSDDELDNVAGGGCYAKDGRLVVTIDHLCYHFICKRCGSKRGTGQYAESCNGCRHTRIDSAAHCATCKFCTYEKGLWLCNNPENNK